MGACGFEYYVKKRNGIDTALKAFTYAVKDAKFMHGSGGYTGTIAEKQHFKIAGRVGSEDEAYRMFDSILNDDTYEKWGPAACIEVLNSRQIGKAFTRKAKIEADSVHEARDKFLNSLEKNTALIGDVQVTLKKPGKIKINTNVPEEKTVLRYVLDNRYVFTSKSEAVKFAKEMIKNRFETGLSRSSLIIEQKKVLEDTTNSKIITVFGEQEPNIYEVVAKLKKTEIIKDSVQGWYFCGWASY